MKGVRKISLLLLMLILTYTYAVAESPFSISGYFKNFSIVLKPSDIEGLLGSKSPSMGMVKDRLRLNMFYDISDRCSIDLAYDISPRIQDQALFDQDFFMTQVDPYSYRCRDLDSRLYPGRGEEVRSFAVFQNLDRAFLAVKLDFADIYIGRQAIAWGSARTINPTDIIAPFTYEELDTEDRIGVDALRLRIPMGFMGEIDLGYVAGEDFKNDRSALFVRDKFYVAKTDVSLILMRFQENVLAGIDFTRAIGGAGFWWESAYVMSDACHNFDLKNNDNYFRTTVGMDYNFSGSTYGFLEYHYSDAGSGRSKNYLSMFEKSAVSQGSVYLMGRHYLIPGLTCQISPLVMFTGQALFNLEDQSSFIAPQIEYNIAENIYLSGGIMLSIGERPAYRVTSGLIPGLSLNSEFGSYPDMYFGAFRVYF